MSLLEVSLVVKPASAGKSILLRDLDQPITIHTDNVATRSMTCVFPKENRCTRPLTKMYRSNDGYVQLLGLTEPNETAPENNSEYTHTGKMFTYTFSPGSETTFSMRLTIYNGFGEGQREWHDHLAGDANCKLFRLTLDLSAYHDAGYAISPEPALVFSQRKCHRPYVAGGPRLGDVADSSGVADCVAAHVGDERRSGRRDRTGLGYQAPGELTGSRQPNGLSNPACWGVVSNHPEVRTSSRIPRCDAHHSHIREEPSSRMRLLQTGTFPDTAIAGRAHPVPG